MYTYEANTVWQRDKQGTIHAADRPGIGVAAPPEFGGPAGVWSPEQLFMASIDSCLMNTFLFFAQRSAIKMHSYKSMTVGRMDKTPDGLRFTAVDVSITVGVDGDSDVEKTTRLQAKLEKYCPISTSLRCPVTLSLKVAVREGHER
jgi:organic hydroperoxide reductase OsmC/OhrA